MSYPQPPYRWRARNFAPGFLDTPEPDVMPEGSSPSAKNCMLTKGTTGRAILSRRNGSRLITPNTMENHPVVGLWDFRPETLGARRLLAVSNGKLWLFNGTDVFTQVGATSPFVVDSPVHGATYRNNLFLMDGSVLKRYDGTSLLDVGFAAPATAPTLGTAAGPGVTGTYEGYVVWYDSASDHESSPGAICTAVVFANQQRQWGRPASPPATATHWRVYCRRTDTNEVLFMRVGTVAIGTTTLTEAIGDTARVDPGPSLSSNDPPPVLTLLGFWKGFGIGATAGSSYLPVSKVGDPQSWHPKDLVPARPGDGGEPRALVNYGTEFLVFKAHRTLRLKGDRMPFVAEELHSAYGCVGQEAAVEVDGRLFAWDEVRGPYVTDLSTWKGLADGMIETTLASVNQAGVSDIRAVHDEIRHLVIWAVPTDSTGRRRTLLAYNYVLGAWLPPITGLEYGALTMYQNGTDVPRLYMGDWWGRVFVLFEGRREGVPTGASFGLDYTVVAPIAGAGTDWIGVGGGRFYTTGSGLLGFPVAVVSPDGQWQWRRAIANTIATVTVDIPWSTVPATDGTWTVVVGGIDWSWWTPWIDMGLPEQEKLATWLTVVGRASSSAHPVEASLRFNDEEGTVASDSLTLEPGVGAGVWGVSLWDAAMWGGTQTSRRQKKRIERAFFSMQLKLACAYPDQDIDITMLLVEADAMVRRRASSGG